jgi:hypothetical protein
MGNYVHEIPEGVGTISIYRVWGKEVHSLRNTITNSGIMRGGRFMDFALCAPYAP